MNEQWLQEYVLLTLRIDKLIQQLSKNRFVDHYYGPAEWKVAVVAEPAWPVLALLRTAGVLADRLSAQQFAASRAAYLSKQVLALETVCRRLNGETFSLEEEVQRCFDIHPTWVPESQFEQALALYDAALPGAGSVAKRLRVWRKRYELVPDRSGLLAILLQRALTKCGGVLQPSCSSRPNCFHP